MAERRTIHKLEDSARFFDLSDYARPLAARIVAALLPTRVSPIHLTLAFTACGLGAAALFATGNYWPGLVGGALLLLKSTLDAADGSLARARGRPSRVGRYLDSVCDFVVNAAVFGGLAWAEAIRQGASWPLAVALAALLVATIEGSVFHYYYVLLRHAAAGDRTSLFDEREARPYAWDPPRLTRALQLAYLAIYWWQDQMVAWLDRRAAGSGRSAAPPSPAFLTATTALGLGSQLLLIAVCAAFGRPFWALYLFLVPGLLYWGLLLVWRKMMSLLDPSQIDSRLASLPSWKVEGGELTKTFVVRSFTHGVVFIGAIAQLAEAADHHPDVSLHGYRHVTLRLSTHSAGGITDKDFALAGQIEALPHKAPAQKTVA